MSFTGEGKRSFIPISRGHVGVFYVLGSNTKASQSFNVFSNQNIVIGRSRKSCHYVIKERTVSNKHLQIYTIVFDQEKPTEVAPLVYARNLSRVGTLWNRRPMWDHNGGVLLSDGDILRLAPGIKLEFRCSRVDKKQRFDEIQRNEMKRFEEEYVITKRMLGSGAYGKVHMAIDSKTCQQLACKVIDVRAIKGLKRLPYQTPIRAEDADFKTEIRKWSEDMRKKKSLEQKAGRCHREAEILEHIQHPNIIGIERVIKTPDTVYILQDLVTAGDLFSFLEFKKGKLHDIEAAVIIRQILIALEYLHEQNIVHRDLKPDNILMTSLLAGSRVVLTDFGCARTVDSGRERMSTVMGTLEYTAPEITGANDASKKGYTKAVDLWSLGCVSVVLLTGGSPFTDPITNMYSQKLAHECDLEKLELDEDWMSVGERPKDFVRRLLVLDENQRMTATQALAHEWFTNPAHKEEYEKLYNRAVRDWKPPFRRVPILSELNPEELKQERSPSPRPRLYDRKIAVDPPYKPSPAAMIRKLYRNASSSALNTPVLSPEKLPPPGAKGRKKHRSHEKLMGEMKPRHIIQILSQRNNDLPQNQNDADKQEQPKETPGGSEKKDVSQKPISHPTPESETVKDAKGRSGTRVRRAYSPEAWDKSDGVIRRRPLKFPDDFCNGPISNNGARRETREDKANIPQHPINTPPKMEYPPRCTLKRPRCPDYIPKRTKSGDEVFDFEEDQVFEEVDDGISGKRRRVAYGQDLGSAQYAPGYGTAESPQGHSLKRPREPDEEENPGKRRRVSYGPDLGPGNFAEAAPLNGPLKRPREPDPTPTAADGQVSEERNGGVSVKKRRCLA